MSATNTWAGSYVRLALMLSTIGMLVAAGVPMRSHRRHCRPAD
jgi:hypothetical protein